MPVPLTPARVSPARRGHKKETTCGFLLLVNLPLSLRGHGENRRDETAPKRGTAEDFFFRRGAQCAPIPLPIRSVRYSAATQAVQSPQARHKVNCPTGNSPCAALCVDYTTCVAERYLTLRICGYMDVQSASCGRKNPLPFPHSLSSEQPPCPPKRKRDSQGWKPWCPSLCPSPWVRCPRRVGELGSLRKRPSPVKGKRKEVLP